MIHAHGPGKTVVTVQTNKIKSIVKFIKLAVMEISIQLIGIPSDFYRSSQKIMMLMK